MKVMELIIVLDVELRECVEWYLQYAEASVVFTASCLRIALRNAPFKVKFSLSSMLLSHSQEFKF